MNQVVRSKSARLLAGLFVLAATCQASLAGTVTATFDGVVSGTAAVHMSFFNTRNNVSENVYAYAGLLKWKQAVGSSTPFVLPSTFTTFCIEFTQDIGGSDRPTYVVDTLANAPKPYGGLTGNPASGMGIDNGLGTTSKKDVLIKQLWAKYGSEVSNTLSAAAFQISIWKIIYEDSAAANAYTSLYSGNMRMTDTGGDFTTIANKASTYLNFLRDNTATANIQTGLYSLTNAESVYKYQDQLYHDGSSPAGRPTTIPLPVTSLMGSSLLLVGLCRRSR